MHDSDIIKISIGNVFLKIYKEILMCFVFFFLKINYTQNTLDNFVIYSNRIGTCVLLTQYRYFNLKYRNYVTSQHARIINNQTNWYIQ